MNVKLLALPLLAAAILMVGAAACAGGNDNKGSDSGNVPTLEEFMQNVQQLDTAFSNRNDELDTAFDDDIAAAQTESDAIALGRQYFSDRATALQTFVDGLDALEAPSEGQQVQNDAVTAGRQALEALDSLLDELNNAETQQDFVAATDDPDLDDAFNAFSDTCVTAQALADENNIDVTFHCEDSGSQ